MTDSNDTDEWFEARKRPIRVEARGPYTDPAVVETIEGDFEVDDAYIDEHGGYYIVRGVTGEVYPVAKDIFEQTYDRDGEKLGTPVMHCSDGPRLLLANGMVVSPRVSFDQWDKMICVGYDQGAAVYGPEVDDPRLSIAFVDDPEAAEHIDLVADRLSDYGFGPTGESDA